MPVVGSSLPTHSRPQLCNMPTLLNHQDDAVETTSQSHLRPGWLVDNRKISSLDAGLLLPKLGTLRPQIRLRDCRVQYGWYDGWRSTCNIQ